MMGLAPGMLQVCGGCGLWQAAAAAGTLSLTRRCMMGLAPGMLQVCGGCGLVRFCAECQAAAWPNHKRLGRMNHRQDPVDPAFYDMHYAQMLPRVPPTP